MAVIDVKRGFRHSAGSESADGKTGSRDADEVYTITLGAPATDNAFTALAHADVPKVGDPHPDDATQFVRRVRGERTSPVLVEARINYDVKGHESGTSPLLEPAKFEWDGEDTDEPIDTDIHGNPLCTVLGEGYDPPVTREFADRVLTVTRNQLVHDEILYSSYSNATNSDIFGVWAPGRVRCKRISASSQRDNIDYWTVTFRFVMRYNPFTTAAKTWWKRIRHEGFYEMLPGGSIVRACELDAGGLRIPGQYMTVPVLLDKNTGQRMTSPTPPTPPTAHWMEYEVFHKLPFSTLQIF